VLRVSAEGMLPLAVARWVSESGYTTAVFVASDDSTLEELVTALPTFLPDYRILAVPGWDSLPYDRARRPGATLEHASRRWPGWLMGMTNSPSY
jgi:hypothetical protein